METFAIISLIHFHIKYWHPLDLQNNINCKNTKEFFSLLAARKAREGCKAHSLKGCENPQLYTHTQAEVVNLSILIACLIYISLIHMFFILTVICCCCRRFISIRLSKSVDDAMLVVPLGLFALLRPRAEANCCT